jgi:hypothetical protein
VNTCPRLTDPLSRRAHAILALLAIGATGAADPGSIRMQVDDGSTAPFTEAELVEAIRLRMDAARIPMTMPIVVTAGPEGELRIAVGERQRRITLGVERGLAAARTAALLAVDLVPPPDQRVATAPPPLRADPAPSVGTAVPPGDRVSQARPDWHFTPALLVGPNDARLEVGLEIARRLTSSWRLMASTGYSYARHRDQPEERFTHSAPVRLGVGYLIPGGELQAGGLARVHWQSGAQGVVFGGWLQARLIVVRRPGWTLSGVIGMEAVPRPLEVRLDQQTTLQTLRVTPLVGLGVTLP